ncbi:MAG: hypothetical protein ACR2GD_08035 [Pyrinomonadaceae bacterium]
MKKFCLLLIFILSFYVVSFPQNNFDEKAEAVVKRAVEKLGGEKYLQVKSQVSTGNFTLLAGGQPQQPSSFVDVIVYPRKERTEFKQSGAKTIQTNDGEKGWIFDGANKTIREQTKSEIEDFERGLRASFDNLLRGGWRGKAVLNYVGRRQASIGKRNDVVRLTFPDNFAVEFEFADDALPVKAIYKRKNSSDEDVREENRYAQFVETDGVLAPFIVDHFVADQHASRINYLSIEFNKNIPDSIFNKPSNAKALKDLKL